MAKMKIDIDWKALFLHHGEKAVVAMVSVMVVLLVWSAVTREGMPNGQEPLNIANLTAEVDQNINRADNWIEYPHRPELKGFRERAVMHPIKGEIYDSKARFDPLDFKLRRKRKDPEFLTVTDIEVRTGFGPFAIPEEPNNDGRRDFNFGRGPGRRARPGDRGGPFGAIFGGAAGEEDEEDRLKIRPLPPWFSLEGVQAGGNDRIEGRRWVIVTALVPKAKQLEAYDSTFKDAEGYVPERDVPDYLGAIVERADVTKGGKPDWKRAFRMTATSLEKLNAIAAPVGARGGVGVMEVVDDRYIHESLTFPLGRLMGRDWGEKASHSQVPLALTQEEIQERLEEEAETEAVEEEPEDPDELFPDREEENARLGIPGRNPRARRRGNRMPRGIGMGILGPMNGRRGGDQEDVPNYLFRYFDFEVVPGHQYIYRVKLIMRDPNNPDRLKLGPRDANNLGLSGAKAKVSEEYLSEEVMDRIAKSPAGYLFSKNSPPSPIAAVPLDGEVFAGAVKAASPSRFNDEPEAKVLVREFDFEAGRGVEIMKKEFKRGAVTRFKEEVWIVDQRVKQLVLEENQSFRSDVVLLDLRGGERIDRPTGRPSRLTVPGEIILRNSAGYLIVRRELEDHEELSFHEDLFVQQEVDKDNKRGAGLPPAGFMDGMFPGMMGRVPGNPKAGRKSTSREKAKKARGGR